MMHMQVVHRFNDLDINDLLKDLGKRDEFEDNYKESVARGVGVGVKPENVIILNISAGSVVVRPTPSAAARRGSGLGLVRMA